MYEVFEHLLQSYGISAYKFCKDTGISQSTISTWKKKNNLISGELAKKIADYFNVPLRVNNVFTPFAGIFVTNVLQIEMLGDIRKHQ